jgi:hypothetical protein
MGAEAGGAIVFAACQESRTMEGVNGGAILRGERDVQRPFQFSFASDPEKAFSPAPAAA